MSKFAIFRDRFFDEIDAWADNEFSNSAPVKSDIMSLFDAVETVGLQKVGRALFQTSMGWDPGDKSDRWVERFVNNPGKFS